jgi:hypothetical protein
MNMHYQTLRNLLNIISILLPTLLLSIEPTHHILLSLKDGVNSSNFDVIDILKTTAALHIGGYIVISLSSLYLFCYLHLKFCTNVLTIFKHSVTSIGILWSVLAGISIVHINQMFYPDSYYSLSSNIINNPIIKVLLVSINIPPIIYFILKKKKTSLTLLIILMVFDLPFQKTTHSGTEKNIFIIGIDSLRPELIVDYMPHLYKQLQTSAVMKNAYTPLARTYPSWNSILTGRHPVKHGARFNLQNESMLDENNIFLPQVLANKGYQTIYAADERRFSNIGNHHGFQSIVGPRTGASDFILGSYADFPTSNLLLLLPFFHHLLPELYANRAAHRLYRPGSFNILLDTALNKLEPTKPVFMATHFCLPHWPYTFVGHTNNPGYKNHPGYPSNLIAVDHQIKLFMTNLKRLGLLDNSILIFLSDHGESWGKFETGFRNSAGEAYTSFDYGHGMNILSPNSHKILLSMKGIEIDQNNKESLSSLIDITPTILDELNLLDHLNQDYFDGRSLKRPASHKIELTFESGVILAEANVPNPNPKAVAKAGSHRFTILNNGELRLRDEMIKHMISAKQKGIRVGSQGLFYMKKSTAEPWIYIDYNSNYFEQAKTISRLAPVSLITRLCDLYANEDTTLNNICVTK